MLMCYQKKRQYKKKIKLKKKKITTVKGNAALFHVMKIPKKKKKLYRTPISTKYHSMYSQTW